MTNRRQTHLSGAALLALALAIFAPRPAFAQASPGPNAPPVPKSLKHHLAPLAATNGVVVSHAPFEDGDCSLCHQNKDPQNPGPLAKPVNETCFDCHDDFQKMLGGKSSHAAARETCSNCHNPHNAKFPKLLVADSTALCLACHQSVSNLVAGAKVKHDALTMGAECANCHNPHGATIEHLLTRLPYDLCVDCHGKDGVKDDAGRTLTNFKKLLEENPEAHGPVASKDCSACHKTHGGDNFRLLTLDYPAQFYSAYDPKLYALCFDCHEETVVNEAKTTTLTKFRNGDQNLHFVHVNKSERGRTCRACHEVHASRQKHQVRDAVPYGPKGWLLKVNFTQTSTGGSCAKTCHETRSYTNAIDTAAAPVSAATLETKPAAEAEPAKPAPSAPAPARNP